MSTNKEYRYTKSIGKREKELNIHIREMVEMLKNEQVKEHLYVKAIKLSAHAFERMQEHYSTKDLAVATRVAKELLKNAVRIGTVLSYDGRINVLYAYQQTAFFLSPDLKTVVTVNKFSKVSYKPLAQKDLDREEMLKLHFERLKDIEKKENAQMQLILSIEEKVAEATKQCVSMLSLVRGCGRKKSIKQLIAEYNYYLKIEARKLFELKIEKRHVCKSLVSLY